MTSRNYVKLKTPTNFRKIDFTSQFNDHLTPSIKLKSNIHNYQNLLNKRKYVLGRPNLHRSFLTSSAPFNYYRNPVDKNSYLVCYNGGPQNQLFSFINRDDINQEYCKNNKEPIFRSIKPCGCPSQQPIPKLSRNLSYLNNKMDNNNGKTFFNNCEKINCLPQRPLSRNEKLFNGFRNVNTLRRSKDGKIIFTLKKFIGENNKLNSLRYEDKKEDEKIDKKNMLLRNRYGSIYAFRPRINKIFHRTQIFDHCKPFLVDEFQEFPD